MLTLCFVIVIGSAILIAFEGRLVFMPDRTMHTTPGAHGLPYRSISFPSGDGNLLYGWYVPADQPRALVLVCHGNAGNISTRIPLIEGLHSMGLSLFIFDYEGYGRSEGRPTEAGTYRDASAAWDWLNGNVAEASRLPMIIMGRSLGGPVAARLAKQHPPAALVLDSTFPSLAAFVHAKEPLLPARLLLRFRFDTIASLEHAAFPILVVHSRGDEVVPFSLGEELYRDLPGRKSFLALSGPHVAGFEVDRSVYVDGLERFLERFGVLTKPK